MRLPVRDHARPAVHLLAQGDVVGEGAVVGHEDVSRLERDADLLHRGLLRLHVDHREGGGLPVDQVALGERPCRKSNRIVGF